MIAKWYCALIAGMAELVDAMDSRPIVARHESSSLSPGTLLGCSIGNSTIQSFVYVLKSLKDSNGSLVVVLYFCTYDFNHIRNWHHYNFSSNSPLRIVCASET